MPNPTPAVIGHIQGGLGNQLFCYAAARALALRSGLPLRLNTRTGYRDEKFGRDCLLKHFEIDAPEAGWWQAFRGPLGRQRRSAAARYAADKPLQERAVIREPRNQSYMEGLPDLRATRTAYLLGYWQNEAYFEDAADTLRDELRLRANAPVKPDPETAALAEQPDTVSVHMRSYGEVSNPTPGLVLDAAYYGPALDALSQTLPDAELLVFSDDPAWAKSIIEQTDHANRAAYAPQPHADATTATLTDFALMKRCRHHVVGNSSFSWWTAWLGEREGSRIAAPPTGLPGHGGGFPDRWLTLMR